jgi:hypothetical protein
MYARPGGQFKASSALPCDSRGWSRLRSQPARREGNLSRETRLRRLGPRGSVGGNAERFVTRRRGNSASRSSLRQWCRVLEAMDTSAALRVFPRADPAALSRPFRDLRSVQCGINAVIALNVSGDTATAQVHEGRAFVARSGNASTADLLATYRLVRPAARAGRIIESATYRPM